MYHATAECIWARGFLAELGLLPDGPTTLHCDNEASIQIANFHMINPRSKHFDTKYHYTRDQILNQTVALQHCPGALNVADIWTKALGLTKFSKFRTALGVLPPRPQHVKGI